MIKLDESLLQELGLATLPPEEKKKLLAHIYETLEMRVGMELAKQMSDAQLAEFEGFIKGNDEPGALRWLESNFPHYKEVVQAEFEKLKNEVRQVVPHILASSIPQQHASPMPPQPPMPPAQPYAPPQPMPGQYPQQPMQMQPQMPPAGYGSPVGPGYPPQPPQYQPPYPPQPGMPAPGSGTPPQPSQSDYDLAA